MKKLFSAAIALSAVLMLGACDDGPQEVEIANWDESGPNEEVSLKGTSWTYTAPISTMYLEVTTTNADGSTSTVASSFPLKEEVTTVTFAADGTFTAVVEQRYAAGWDGAKADSSTATVYTDYIEYDAEYVLGTAYAGYANQVYSRQTFTGVWKFVSGSDTDGRYFISSTGYTSVDTNNTGVATYTIDATNPSDTTTSSFTNPFRMLDTGYLYYTGTDANKKKMVYMDLDSPGFINSALGTGYIYTQQ